MSYNAVQFSFTMPGLRLGIVFRRKAHSLSIDVIGAVGLLFLLEKRKLLSAEQTWQKMQQLTGQHGIYLAPPLLQQIESGC